MVLATYALLPIVMSVAMTNTAKWALPLRRGPKPRTTSRLPHSQIDQHGPKNVIDALSRWCFDALPGVVEEPSGISVPGARALVCGPNCRGCNRKAFMVNREFAHIHPAPDLGSLHVVLTAHDAHAVIDSGWGEDHYLVTQGQWPKGLVMVFSPRDTEELETVQAIVKRSYEFALSSSSPNN